MSRYVSATVKSYSRVKTKADLKRAVAAINAGEPNADVDVEIADTFGPLGYGTAGLEDLLSEQEGDFEGVALQLANPKRSWFATVEVKGGKLTVI